MLIIAVSGNDGGVGVVVVVSGGGGGNGLIMIQVRTHWAKVIAYTLCYCSS